MDLSDAVIVKSSRLKSVVWNDFDRVRKDDIYVAICRHCKKKLSGSSTSGTSHLRNHLLRCRRRTNHGVENYFSIKGKKEDVKLALVNVDHASKKNEGLNIVNVRYEHEHTKDDTVTIASASLDQRRSRFDLARMIILQGYPLTMVEDVGFRGFIRNLQPLFELVSFERVESDCMEIYAKEKHKLFEVLDKLAGKISVSVDVWAVSDVLEFLCLTAHYIDDAWRLKKRILNFFLVDQTHTDDMHTENVMTCLMEWDIDRKLFSMTSDHSLPFGEGIANKIRDRLSQNKFLYCNGQLFDVSCAVNVLNQMAQDALEASFEIVHKISESIRYVKSSEIIQERFNQLVLGAGVKSQRHLYLDNPTRWDSTYNMLEVGLEHKGAFSLLKEVDSGYMTCPTDLEWDRLSAICGFLKLFLEVTNVIVRDSSCSSTANTLFPEMCDVHLRLIEWSKNPDDFIGSLSLNMRKKFDEFWDKSNLALAISAILDPRFKMKLIEYYYPLLYGASASELINDVFECIKALYNEHSIGSPLASANQALEWHPNGVHGKDSTDRMMEFDKFVNDSNPGEDCKSDLEKYLEEPLFSRNSEFDILDWWKVQTPKYPVLSMVARNVLAIPMSKVASENAFDMGRRAVNHHWISLRPSTLQALMCAQDWIRNELES